MRPLLAAAASFGVNVSLALLNSAWRHDDDSAEKYSVASLNVLLRVVVSLDWCAVLAHTSVRHACCTSWAANGDTHLAAGAGWSACGGTAAWTPFCARSRIAHLESPRLHCGLRAACCAVLLSTHARRDCAQSLAVPRVSSYENYTVLRNDGGACGSQRLAAVAGGSRQAPVRTICVVANRATTARAAPRRRRSCRVWVFAPQRRWACSRSCASCGGPTARAAC